VSSVNLSREHVAEAGGTYQRWMAVVQSRPSMQPPFTETTFLPCDDRTSSQQGTCKRRATCHLQELCGSVESRIACKSNCQGRVVSNHGFPISQPPPSLIDIPEEGLARRGWPPVMTAPSDSLLRRYPKPGQTHL